MFIFCYIFRTHIINVPTTVIQNSISFLFELFFVPFLLELCAVFLVGVTFGFILLYNHWIVFAKSRFMTKIIALLAFDVHFQRAKGIYYLLRICSLLVQIVTSHGLERSFISLKIVVYQCSVVCILVIKMTKITIP